MYIHIYTYRFLKRAYNLIHILYIDDFINLSKVFQKMNTYSIRLICINQFVFNIDDEGNYLN